MNFIHGPSGVPEAATGDLGHVVLPTWVSVTAWAPVDSVWSRISIPGIRRLLDKGQYLLLVQTLCWRNKGKGCMEVVLRLWGCAWNSERGFYWELQKKHMWFLKKYCFNFYSAFLLKWRVTLNLKLPSSSSSYSNNSAGYHRSPSTEGVQPIHSHIACWK